MGAMGDMGFHFNEKQICITKVESIVNRYKVKEKQELLEEVII